MHIRQQILERIETLVTGLPSTGAKVFRSQVYPLTREQVPGIRVKFAPNTEDLAPVTMGAPRRYERVLRILVEPAVRTTDGFDAALNTSCLEIEQALAMPAAAGPWKTLTLRRVDIEMTGGGEQPLCSASMLYEAGYFNREDAPDTAL